MSNDELLDALKKVLADNDRGKYTVPAADIYPHQWLWDSCFIAIGLRHINIKRAQQEVLSLLRGQWANGMLPHMIFAAEGLSWQTRHMEAWVNPHAPNHVVTSGITQPPMLAEAVWKIGEKMPLPERRSWFARVYPNIVNYHNWLYKERDYSGSGLICLVHPYESGLDNTPPAIAATRRHAWPLWLKLFEKVGLDGVANFVRRDIKSLPPGQRMANAEAIAYWNLMRHLKKRNYVSADILRRPRYAIEDIVFNSVLVRANRLLGKIAETIGHNLPNELAENRDKTETAMELLWDGSDGLFYSRDALGSELIDEPTIGSLLPIYGGMIENDKVERLASLLGNRKWFKPEWPVPSVPLNSSFFADLGYWQGPSWINTNWLLIDGLERYGYHDQAAELRKKTIELVRKSGPSEYFSPINGHPAGAHNFSWTAALLIDLLNH